MIVWILKDSLNSYLRVTAEWVAWRKRSITLFEMWHILLNTSHYRSCFIWHATLTCVICSWMNLGVIKTLHTRYTSQISTAVLILNTMDCLNGVLSLNARVYTLSVSIRSADVHPWNGLFFKTFNCFVFMLLLIVGECTYWMQPGSLLCPPASIDHYSLSAACQKWEKSSAIPKLIRKRQ